MLLTKNILLLKDGQKRICSVHVESFELKGLNHKQNIRCCRFALNRVCVAWQPCSLAVCVKSEMGERPDKRLCLRVTY